MKITTRMLSIPPHLTVPWDNVAALRLEGENLVVSLADGTHVSVPSLEPKAIAQIFANYENYIESPPPLDDLAAFQEEVDFLHGPGAYEHRGKMVDEPETNNGSIRFGLRGLEGMNGVMAHNPDYSDAPDIPPEALKKIAGIARIVAPGDIDAIPKAEPHCNCPHCQISRAIRGEEPKNAPEEEQVDDAELTFREWDIQEIDKNRYTVTNPLDTEESYTVFLGDEIGCTCGKPNCEHVRHVLMS